jgi:hypothetical protein
MLCVRNDNLPILTWMIKDHMFEWHYVRTILTWMIKDHLFEWHCVRTILTWMVPGLEWYCVM